MGLTNHVVGFLQAQLASHTLDEDFLYAYFNTQRTGLSHQSCETGIIMARLHWVAVRVQPSDCMSAIYHSIGHVSSAM